MISVVKRSGGRSIDRPMVRDDPSSPTTPDVELAAGMAVARATELAARRRARDYIKDAREAGMTWQEIGAVLGLVEGGDVVGDSLGECAFSYAPVTRTLTMPAGTACRSLALPGLLRADQRSRPPSKAWRMTSRDTPRDAAAWLPQWLLGMRAARTRTRPGFLASQPRRDPWCGP